jgi:hypothetical protein
VVARSHRGPRPSPTSVARARRDAPHPRCLPLPEGSRVASASRAGIRRHFSTFPRANPTIHHTHRVTCTGATGAARSRPPAASAIGSAGEGEVPACRQLHDCAPPAGSKRAPRTLLQGPLKDKVRPGPGPRSAAGVPGVAGVPLPPGARAPEAAEALLVAFEKVAQVELRDVLAVPVLQLLEVRVPGERGHGGARRVHGPGRARKRKRGAATARRAEPRGARPPLWRRRAPRPKPRPGPAAPALPAARCPLRDLAGLARASAGLSLPPGGRWHRPWLASVLQAPPGLLAPRSVSSIPPKSARPVTGCVTGAGGAGCGGSRTNAACHSCCGEKQVGKDAGIGRAILLVYFLQC